MNNCVWYFCIYLCGLSLNGWHAVLNITNNRHDVTITTHAIKRHFLIWMTTVRQPKKRRCSCVSTLKYTFICVNWWTRQRIHNTLIAVDLYLRLIGDKTIPDSAEPRLESFYPPFVAGIDLPHQGVVDSYNLPACLAEVQQHESTLWQVWHGTEETDKLTGWKMYQLEVFSAGDTWIESFIAYPWVILLYFSPESRLTLGMFELGQVRFFWKFHSVKNLTAVKLEF